MPIRRIPELEAGDHDSLREILNAELELGRLLFTAGSPGQRILDSITFLNEKLERGKLKVFLGFEALVISIKQGEKRGWAWLITRCRPH